MTLVHELAVAERLQKMAQFQMFPSARPMKARVMYAPKNPAHRVTGGAGHGPALWRHRSKRLLGHSVSAGFWFLLLKLQSQKLALQRAK